MQRVGYRDLVADRAMDLGVVGFVENQPDGTVKIVLEGEEGILEEFVKKAQPEDDPLIRITQVDVAHEKATGEFEFFEIKRGSSEDYTPLADSNGTFSLNLTTEGVPEGEFLISAGEIEKTIYIGVAPPPSPSPSPSFTPTPTETELSPSSPSLIPGFEIAFAIVGLLAGTYLLRRRKQKRK